MRKLPLAALVALLATAPVAPAQEMQPTWFTIITDHVEIANMKAFEETSLEFIRLFEGKNFEDMSWITITGPELGYTYAIPGMGPEDMGAMNAEWSAAMTSLGDAGARLQAKTDALVSSREMYYLLLRPDLSYRPEAVGFTPSEPHRTYVQFRVVPAKVAEFEASARAWSEAYGRHGVDHGFRLYQYITGADLPMYLLVKNARDEAHAAAMSAQLTATLGADNARLMEQTGTTLRSVREMRGTVRPELSFPALPGGS
ncbi:MAG: hypothetical protein M8835_00205 [marine benthic group bacterium]|jgi:hypothetical protein|nr:hypothetical protein [Gemmatimonadota bacterium]